MAPDTAAISNALRPCSDSERFTSADSGWSVWSAGDRMPSKPTSDREALLRVPPASKSGVLSSEDGSMEFTALGAPPLSNVAPEALLVDGNSYNNVSIASRSDR